jgi:hypothetical protein
MVWATRYRQGGPLGYRRPLIVRLTDTGWQIDASPNPYPDGWSVLDDMAVFGVPTLDSGRRRCGRQQVRHTRVGRSSRLALHTPKLSGTRINE